MAEPEQSEEPELAAVCGGRIRLARRSRRWTQYDLQDASGIFQGCISHFECGMRVPVVQNLIRLSDALEVSVDYLLGRAPPPFQTPEEPEPRRLRSRRRRPREQQG